MKFKTTLIQQCALKILKLKQMLMKQLRKKKRVKLVI